MSGEWLSDRVCPSLPSELVDGYSGSLRRLLEALDSLEVEVRARVAGYADRFLLSQLLPNHSAEDTFSIVVCRTLPKPTPYCVVITIFQYYIYMSISIWRYVYV